MDRDTHRIRHLDAYVYPITGKPINHTRCGICGTLLPLPGDYIMMVVEHRPDAKLFDLTGDSGSTDRSGNPKVLQNGLTVLRPICWHHAQ